MIISIDTQHLWSGPPQGFGAPATPAFGQTAFGAQPAAPAFGAAPAPAFGATAAPAFGGAPAFGAAAPAAPTFGAAFGASTGAFGSAAPAFGATASAAAPAFGATTTSPGFGGGAFGAPAAAASSPFGAPQQSNVFGAATGGSPGFGQPAMGTRNVAFAKHQEKETSSTGATSYSSYVTITAMPAYNGKSTEELRWEDYQQGVKSSAAGPVQPAAGTGGVFGTTAPAASPFGAPPAPAFGSTGPWIRLI